MSNSKQLKNWPSNVQYTTKLHYSLPNLCRLIQEEVDNDRTKPQVIHYQPQSLVKIGSLKDFPNHPAYPHFGLFANKRIPPFTLILPYLGMVTPSNAADPSSDYCLGYYNHYAIDANKIGNEARFINDYRNVKDKPNVEFKEYIDKNSSQLMMGVFSTYKAIEKNEELLINYGKGFWKSRGLLQDDPSDKYLKHGFDFN